MTSLHYKPHRRWRRAPLPPMEKEEEKISAIYYIGQVGQVCRVGQIGMSAKHDIGYRPSRHAYLSMSPLKMPSYEVYATAFIQIGTPSTIEGRQTLPYSWYR